MRIAAYNGHTGVIETLHALGADVSTPDNDGFERVLVRDGFCF